MFKPSSTKDTPNRLLAVLDQEIGFENRIRSRVTSIKRGYDERSSEYVIWIEYRTMVRPGTLKERSQPERFPLLHEISVKEHFLGKRESEPTEANPGSGEQVPVPPSPLSNELGPKTTGN